MGGDVRISARGLRPIGMGRSNPSVRRFVGEWQGIIGGKRKAPAALRYTIIRDRAYARSGGENVITVDSKTGRVKHTWTTPESRDHVERVVLANVGDGKTRALMKRKLTLEFSG